MTARARQTRHAVARAAGWSAAAGAVLPLVAAAAVVAVDRVRKRRSPGTTAWPKVPPSTVAVGGSRVTTYTHGADLFADMLATIRRSRRTIFFETFIWKGDEVGAEFKRALIDAANRGVDVYVIYDAFANLVVRSSFFDFPSTVNVLRFPLLRPGLLHLDLRHTGRDHRKILVVDGNVGFVGGYNVGELYATHWRDTHLRVDGPSVWELENAFVDFWNEFRAASLPELADRGAADWEARIQAARNAPSRMLFPVRGLYLRAIDRAVKRVYITQAYFIPDQEILRSLLAAARRGVDVRILVPEYSNHIIADWVARGYYASLLRGGVAIWLYRDAMVHAKTATVDGRWSTVGTANIDRLSLLGNYEVNLELFSDEQAAHMEEVFAQDLSHSRRLTLAEWDNRGRAARIVERLVSPLQPFL
ncbi:MAG TPA: phospholipase D-like domain-containing protein [Dermatophilaceae bacterium]|nr:phospholipase D-like domain-containing protein [Dermatophilaceae bacterium]